MSGASPPDQLLSRLPSFDPESGDLHVIVETPKGSRNKFDYDPEYRMFRLGGVLPAGAVFPYDFGFIPSTRGEDGDPLDVLLLMDEPAFPGCLVTARLLGAIIAEQDEDDGPARNDRLIAVAATSRNHRDARSLDVLGGNLLEEIEHFFVSYNAAKDKRFKPLGRAGPDEALRLVEEGKLRYSAGTSERYPR